MIEELERMRAYRAAEPPPSDAATAAARVALLKLIRDESPKGTSTKSGSAPAFLSERASGAARVRRTRRVWRARVAMAVALTCVGIVIAGVFGSPTATTAPSATAAALEQLARVAATRAWAGTPGPGQYLYTSSESLTESDILGPGSRECAVKLLQHREIWIATNGAGAIRETDRDGHFTSARDQSDCRLDHVTDPASQAGGGTDRFRPGGLAFPTNNWHALSTDPAKLLVQLRKLDGGPRDAGEDFVHIGDFLRESDAPPAIRAALYRAAKLIPGVRLLGPRRDHAGRIGLGVAWVSHGRPKHELIFNQRTAGLLGENYYNPSGRLADWTVFLESKIVNRLPATH